MNFMKKISIFFVGLILSIITVWDAQADDQVLKVIRITPSGENISPPKEVVIEFDQPMAALGEKVDPHISISLTQILDNGESSPQIKGSWRWISEKTLALSIPEETALKKGSSYQILVKAGLKAKEDAILKEDVKHSFSTEIPKVNYASLIHWESPTLPTLYIQYSQETTKESVEKNLFFISREDPNHRVAATIVAHDSMDCGDNDDSDNPRRCEKPLKKTSLRWNVTPVTSLKPHTVYKLVQLPGLKGTEGTLESTKEEVATHITTFDDFKLVGFSCTPAFGPHAEKEITFNEKNPQTASQKCNPQKPIEFLFSSPVSATQFRKNLVITPDPTQGKAEIWAVPEENDAPCHYLRIDRIEDRTYSLSLPPDLKANTDYTISSKFPGQSRWERLTQRLMSWFKKVPQTAIKDEFGRTLVNPFSVKIMLDHRKPNVLLPYSMAVLEKQTNSDIPLYVNNLTSATFTYQAITSTENIEKEAVVYDIPPVQDIQFAIPMNIKAILKGRSGVIRGQVTTTPEIPLESWQKTRPSHIIQITPFTIQAKVSYQNGLVWVIDMHTGKPVVNAKVTIYYTPQNDMLASGEPLVTTQTNDKGIAYIPGYGALDPSGFYDIYGFQSDKILTIRVDKDDDMAVLPLHHQFYLSDYSLSHGKIWSSPQGQDDDIQAWGFTPQGIYRAGEKIDYKIYVRQEDLKTLTALPHRIMDLTVTDPLNKVIYEQKNIQLNEFGTFSGEISLAKSASVGWYRFELVVHPQSLSQEGALSLEKSETLKKSSKPDKKTLYCMNVLVSDFTPVPFKVEVDVDKTILSKEDTVHIVNHAHLHSGGPYTQAKAKITALFQPKTFTSTHPIATDFNFGYYEESDFYSAHRLLFQKESNLDGKGAFPLTEKIDPIDTKPSSFHGKIVIEGSVQDDRGKTISAYKSLEYFQGERLVGSKANQWIYSAKKPAGFKMIVVDQKGTPQKGSTVEIIVEYKDLSIAKVKSAGNAYRVHENKEWIPVHKQTISPLEEGIDYQFIPEKAGDYRLIATVKDDKGNAHQSCRQFYVTGPDYVAWGEENEYYLPLIPEKTDLAVGEKAKILVKNPYPNAMALITIERSGIIDSFVQPLKGSTSIIEFPVKADYLPNFFVSVSIFSPRQNEKPLKLGELDLAKPANKIGYTSFNVIDKFKEVVVSAAMDKPVYKPGEIVHVDLSAKVKNPTTPGEPLEVALVILDESVFDLISLGMKYYDPYAGLYDKRSLGIQNFNLLKFLVGQMKFATKGANPGGDGGFDVKTRTLFKYVAYWNPSIKLDEEGKARVTFQAPDNLTGWKVLAIAVTPTDRMGMGTESFKVNKETEIRPVMPNQVSEGDQFKAGFTVMNRTDKTREIRFSILAHGDIDLSSSKMAHEELLQIEPHKRVLVEMPIQVGKIHGDEKGEIRFEIAAGDSIDTDKLEHSLPVLSPASLETASFFSSMTQGTTHVPIAQLENVRLDRGGVTIQLSPTMIQNLSGAFDYMKRYPYTCWEQKISRALTASLFKPLEGYMETSVAWADPDSFIQEILKEASNFQAPNGGIAYFRGEDSFVDPFLSAFTALSFSWLQQTGYEIDPAVDDKLMAYLTTLLHNDFMDSIYSFSMVTTVRSLILEARALRDQTTLSDLERYLPHFSEMGAYGRASFIRAAIATPGAEALSTRLINELLSLFNETSTQLTWADNLPKGSERLLDTPLRESCAVMETLMTYATTPERKDLVANHTVKLAKTINEAKKGKDHWGNTQENLHCIRAMAKYAEFFETEKPNMTVAVKVGDLISDPVTFKDTKDRPAEIQTSMIDLMKGIDPSLAGERANPHQTRDIGISVQGTGRVYYTTRLQYAFQKPSHDAVIAGLQIHREHSVLRNDAWILLKEGDNLIKGELVRTDLYIILPGDRTFVVVDDPVPGGLEPVDTKLATTSLMDTRSLESRLPPESYEYKHRDWVQYFATRWSFYHQELRHDRVRYYSDYLPKGNYHLMYMAQVISDGEFHVAPSLVQEMYNPETHGKSRPSHLHVVTPVSAETSTATEALASPTEPSLAPAAPQE